MEEQSKGKGAMIFQVLKWVAIAIGALIVISGLTVGNYIQETTFYTLASLFMILAIFFHLEQHRS